MAGLYAWATRCIPVFSVCLVITLSFLGLFVSPFGERKNAEYVGEATLSQLVLTGYIIFLHALTVIFPLRVCWSVRDVVQRMRKAATDPSIDQNEGEPIFKDEKEESRAQGPLFAIILPAYKEEVSTLEETLRVLASHPQARRSYHVRLCTAWKALEAANTTV